MAASTGQIDPASLIETARSLQSLLESSSLHIVNARSNFDKRIASDDVSSQLPISLGDGVGGGSGGGKLVDPANVLADVSAQMAFFRKLKFQYLEQKAKDQYIKIIVSEDAPSINAQENEELRHKNEEKKQKLKEAKEKARETERNLKTLAPLVEQDYLKAKSLTDAALTLSRQILDTRLQLTRLRQIHPLPRLTVTSANEQLDAQVIEMQKLEDELTGLNDNIEELKGKVKEGAKEVERLRVERGDVERLVKKSEGEVGDARVVELYDWFTASLELHKSLFSLKSFASPSENELHLTYALSSPSTARTSSNHTYPFIIILLFIPNTRQLADAQIEGDILDGDEVAELIGAHVQSNDVAGLIAALLARARVKIGERKQQRT
ncbi:hypothetical protein C8Q75DRAFT_732828 [Abortiporus biennis]|nr:hypothetical protein C8Q75DRAFT_732828 [Abortiporus biennis]